MRERKQSRVLRPRAFFLEINDTVSNMDDTVEHEFDRIIKVALLNPWYRNVNRCIYN